MNDCACKCVDFKPNLENELLFFSRCACSLWRYARRVAASLEAKHQTPKRPRYARGGLLVRLREFCTPDPNNRHSRHTLSNFDKKINDAFQRNTLKLTVVSSVDHTVFFLVVKTGFEKARLFNCMCNFLPETN